MSQKTEHEKLHGDIVGFRFVIVIVGHRSELGKGLLTFQVEKLLSLTLLKNVKKNILSFSPAGEDHPHSFDEKGKRHTPIKCGMTNTPSYKR
jgi:hypothetical protein